jgi:hypothetical protein
MIKLAKSLFLLILIILLGRCSTISQEDEAGRSNLTAGMVKTKIIKGETTQAEILQLFGSPNIITKNRSNDEVWNYNRMTFRTISGEDSGALLIFWSGSRAVSTASTKSFDLIIIFDENDTVKDFSYISASF